MYGKKAKHYGKLLLFVSALGKLKHFTDRMNNLEVEVNLQKPANLSSIITRSCTGKPISTQLNAAN